MRWKKNGYFAVLQIDRKPVIKRNKPQIIKWLQTIIMTKYGG
jgi:hypothetical protein